jgi:hypothetical protein
MPAGESKMRRSTREGYLQEGKGVSCGKFQKGVLYELESECQTEITP